MVCGLLRGDRSRRVPPAESLLMPPHDRDSSRNQRRNCTADDPKSHALVNDKDAGSVRSPTDGRRAASSQLDQEGSSYYRRTTDKHAFRPLNCLINYRPAKGVVLDNGSESSNLSFSAKPLENARFSGVFLFALVRATMDFYGAEWMSTTDTTTDMFARCHLDHF